MRKLSLPFLGVLILAVVNVNTIVDYLDYADHALIREMRSRSGEYFWWELVGSSNRAFNPSESYSEYLDRMRRGNRDVSGKSSQLYREYLKNRDVMVSKHIPLGTTAAMAMEICKQNGFKTNEPHDLYMSDRSSYPGIDKYIYCTVTDFRWYLIGTDEYRVIMYLANNRVRLVTGRHFARIFGGL